MLSGTQRRRMRWSDVDARVEMKSKTVGLGSRKGDAEIERRKAGKPDAMGWLLFFDLVSRYFDVLSRFFSRTI